MKDKDEQPSLIMSYETKHLYLKCSGCHKSLITNDVHILKNGGARVFVESHECKRKDQNAQTD